MDATTFAKILSDLIGRLPGAYACALVDLGGETVDYAGVVDPFDVKVAAAHLRIILNDVDEYAVLGKPRWLVLRGQKRSYIARSLPDGYALIVLLRRRAGFTASARAFAACERELAAEAGWSPLGGAARWFPVDVEIDARGRPVHVGSPAVRVEVFGSVMGLSRGERGFRVRTAAGTELTLVREPGNSWFADDDLVNLTSSRDAS
jgi:hypothetical protein